MWRIQGKLQHVMMNKPENVLRTDLDMFRLLTLTISTEKKKIKQQKARLWH